MPTINSLLILILPTPHHGEHCHVLHFSPGTHRRKFLSRQLLQVRQRLQAVKVQPAHSVQYTRMHSMSNARCTCHQPLAQKESRGKIRTEPKVSQLPILSQPGKKYAAMWTISNWGRVEDPHCSWLVQSPNHCGLP
eukprot:492137-Pelagomonas_calceolata.AAC.9